VLAFRAVPFASVIVLNVLPFKVIVVLTSACLVTFLSNVAEVGLIIEDGTSGPGAVPSTLAPPIYPVTFGFTTGVELLASNE